MADGEGGSGGGGVGIVAIIAILVLVLLVAFFLLRGGIGGGKAVPDKIDVNVKT
ncbi:MAG: hypothetical protein M3Q76_10505 [Acidobacteriota bacterium]|nr:hypothetical protein [Acidobacteriota bacterium]